MIFMYVKSLRDDELRKFRNPLKIIRDYGEFMKILLKKGILKTGLKTHPLLSLIIILVSFLMVKSLLIPVLLGVISHLFADGVHVMSVSKKSSQYGSR